MASLEDLADDEVIALANQVLGALRSQYGPSGKMRGAPEDAVRAALEQIGEDIALTDEVTDMLMVTGFLFKVDPSNN